MTVGVKPFRSLWICETPWRQCCSDACQICVSTIYYIKVICALRCLKSSTIRQFVHLLAQTNKLKLSKLRFTENQLARDRFPPPAISNVESTFMLWYHNKLYSVVVMGAMAFQIAGVSVVCLTVCSGSDQRKHQISESLAFVAVEFPSQRTSDAENVSIC